MLLALSFILLTIFSFSFFHILSFSLILCSLYRLFFFFFNDPAPPEIYTLSLHAALPILPDNLPAGRWSAPRVMGVNGLYRHGFMIAPAMLDVVLELLDSGDSELARRFDVAVEHAPSQHKAAA